MLTVGSRFHAAGILFMFHNLLRSVIDCDETRRRIDCGKSTSVDGGET
jgi:hypothetical protein